MGAGALRRATGAAVTPAAASCCAGMAVGLGGAGTMTVSYNGQTYYVCCTGCRDAFLAEPEKFIAKAKAKKS